MKVKRECLGKSSDRIGRQTTQKEMRADIFCHELPLSQDPSSHEWRVYIFDHVEKCDKIKKNETTEKEDVQSFNFHKAKQKNELTLES